MSMSTPEFRKVLEQVRNNLSALETAIKMDLDAAPNHSVTPKKRAFHELMAEAKNCKDSCSKALANPGSESSLRELQGALNKLFKRSDLNRDLQQLQSRTPLGLHSNSLVEFPHYGTAIKKLRIKTLAGEDQSLNLALTNAYSEWKGVAQVQPTIKNTELSGLKRASMGTTTLEARKLAYLQAATKTTPSPQEPIIAPVTVKAPLNPSSEEPNIEGSQKKEEMKEKTAPPSSATPVTTQKQSSENESSMAAPKLIQYRVIRREAHPVHQAIELKEHSVKEHTVELKVPKKFQSPVYAPIAPPIKEIFDTIAEMTFSLNELQAAQKSKTLFNRAKTQDRVQLHLFKLLTCTKKLDLDALRKYKDKISNHNASLVLEALTNLQLKFANTQPPQDYNATFNKISEDLNFYTNKVKGIFPRAQTDRPSDLAKAATPSEPNPNLKKATIGLAGTNNTKPNAIPERSLEVIVQNGTPSNTAISMVSQIEKIFTAEEKKPTARQKFRLKGDNKAPPIVEHKENGKLAMITVGYEQKPKDSNRLFFKKSESVKKELKIAVTDKGYYLQHEPNKKEAIDDFSQIFAEIAIAKAAMTNSNVKQFKVNAKVDQNGLHYVAKMIAASRHTGIEPPFEMPDAFKSTPLSIDGKAKPGKTYQDEVNTLVEKHLKKFKANKELYDLPDISGHTSKISPLKPR